MPGPGKTDEANRLMGHGLELYETTTKPDDAGSSERHSCEWSPCVACEREIARLEAELADQSRLKQAWKDRAIELRAENERLRKEHQRDLAEARLVYHCIWCDGFTNLPDSDKCGCGGELYPVQFGMRPGARFWPSNEAESRLTTDVNEAIRMGEIADDLAKCREVLRDNQWNGGHYCCNACRRKNGQHKDGPHCPECDMWEDAGHADDCRIGQALGEE
jgi:hypothetical protein